MEEGAQISEARLTRDRYHFVGSYDQIRQAAAAILIAAELVTTAGFAPPPTSQDLGSFVGTIAKRGPGFRGTRMLSLAP